MSIQTGHLVKMANQIALNFGERRDPQGAAHRTAEHLRKFWTRQMRDALSAHVAGEAGDVSPAVRSALAGLLNGEGRKE